MTRTIDETGRGNLSADALRKAVEGAEPDIGHLLEAVPGMLARARADARKDEGLLAEIIPLAWKAIPRLAAAAAILALVAAAAFLSDDTRSGTPRARSAGWLLESESADGNDDLLLRALIEEENGRG